LTEPVAAPPTCSVVVCAYTEERWPEIVRAVESLKHQTVCPHEIFLVIDHNEVLHRRAEREMNGVILLRNTGAQGLSGARNTGLSACTGDVVAFLDDDAAAEPEWLATLAKWYANCRVVAAGGRIRPAWSQAHPAWFPNEFLWVVGCTYEGMPEKAAPVRNLIGANMSFRRSIFGAIGGFNEKLGRKRDNQMGGEETELCIKALQRFEESFIVYDPDAVVHHQVPRNRSSLMYFLRRCQAEGRSKYSLRRSVGGSALKSELSYSLKVLPLGIARGLAEAILHRRLSAGARAGAIILGFMLTTTGYVLAVAETRPRELA
jgi:glycosyltransferase involved in cell wall biosynthesis